MTISNDQAPDADEVLAMSNIRQVYTGTGFNSSQVGTGTDTQDHELDAVASAPDSNYAIVTITGNSNKSLGSSGDVSEVSLKAQMKETGGAYGDILPLDQIFQIRNVTSPVRLGITYRIVATLTAGQKTNGFQIKVFSASTSGAGATTTFVNTQTIQEVRT